MADAINNQPTTDTYADPAALGFGANEDTSFIAFDIGNNPVFVRWFRITQSGLKSELDPPSKEELWLTSLGNVMRGVSGMLLRSANAGFPALVTAKRYTRYDGDLSPGTPFYGTISSGGGLVPPPGGGGTVTVNALHNNTIFATEPGIDLEDAVAAAIGVPGLTWTASDTGGVAGKYVPVLTAPLSPILSYVEFTGNVTISATTEGTANQIVAGAAFTPDGSTPVLIEFFAPSCDAGAATYDLSLYLYDGASSIGLLTELITTAAATDRRTLYVVRRLTPTSAAHTYSIRGSRGASNVTVRAGAGGNGATMPGFIRIRQDNV